MLPYLVCWANACLFSGWLNPRKFFSSQQRPGPDPTQQGLLGGHRETYYSTLELGLGISVMYESIRRFFGLI